MVLVVLFCVSEHSKFSKFIITADEKMKHKKLSYRGQTAQRICAVLNGVADAAPIKTPLTCVTTPNLVVLYQKIWAQVGVPQNCGAAPILGRRDMPTSYKHALYTWVTMLNLIAVGQTVRAYVRKSAGNTGLFTFCLSRSLKVSGTDTG